MPKMCLKSSKMYLKTTNLTYYSCQEVHPLSQNKLAVCGTIKKDQFTKKNLRTSLVTTQVHFQTWNFQNEIKEFFQDSRVRGNPVIHL